MLALPTFALTGCLVAISVLVLAHDAYKSCICDKFASLIQGRLLEASGAQAESSDRTIIVMLPVMMLLLRALVVSQRVVPLKSADQKQLFVCSLCKCCIAAVLSVEFNLASDGRRSSPSFATELRDILLALLVIRIIAQTVIRLRATAAFRVSPKQQRRAAALQRGQFFLFFLR